MSKWVKIRDRIAGALLKWLGIAPVAEAAATEAEAALPAPSCSPLYLASCWDGANASRRMMNMLSPKFSDAKFEEYADWMIARGCNTAHLILANEGDGEGAGYLAHENAELSRRRIGNLRDRGFRIVVWLVTDDSAAYLKEIFANPSKYVNAVADAGLLDEAEIVVLGLEMDEGGSRAQWQALRDALRRRYGGRIGVHHTGGDTFAFASLGDVILDQQDPKKVTAATVKANVAKIRAMGREAIGFEYSRQPNRTLSQAALDAGAIGAGNW